MNEWLQQYWTFYHAGVFIFLIAGLALIFRFLILRKKKKQPGETKLSFKHWNERFNKDFEQLELELRKFPHLPKEAIKLLKKAYKKEQKKEKKQESLEQSGTLQKIREELAKGTSTEDVLKHHSNRVYVLNFSGNIMASQVEQLRDEISFLLQVAQPTDEVVIRLTSPGGAVPNYGLASSQIARLRQRDLKCTVCVDLIAASGGYMMAAVADKIVAAPFAIIGSIGVVAGLPNFHRVLKKHEVDYYLFTAGKYKRTVTPLGEVTEEGQEKMQQDLEAIHHSFKKLIVDHRKEIDIEEVATGEFWLAEEAKEKGLVDEILTSDDYLFDKMKDFEIIEITTKDSRNRIEKLLQGGIELFQSFGRRTSLEDSEIPGIIR
ncbi:MAG: protease SohB [bacterium]